MNASRFFAVLGIVAIAMIAVQTDTALWSIAPTGDAFGPPEWGLLPLLALALLIPFAMSGDGALRYAPRRRRVNRARLRARRATRAA
jgi:hypothetical protein